MHPSVEKAYALLADLEDFEPTQRDTDAPDVLENWDRLRERSTPARQHRELVRKGYGFQPMQQQSSASMDPETETRWNSWLDARVVEHMKSMADVLGEEVGRDHRKMQDEIDALRKELAELRAQPSQPDVKLSGSVMHLTRGNRDVA